MNGTIGKRAVRHVVMGAALAAVMATASAQDRTVRDGEVPQTNLDIPQNLQIFGKVDPNVRKATAIVNDSVITATDVDQRMALIIAANNIQPSPEDRERLRLQIRMESESATNTPNFAAPGTNMSSLATFGVITSAGGSRRMQGSARISF